MIEFLKDYGILVTAVIGLGMAILGYFFGKWDSERKRKWEVQDRDYKKRSEKREIRIKEVGDFVDALYKLMHTLDIDANNLLWLKENGRHQT